MTTTSGLLWFEKSTLHSHNNKRRNDAQNEVSFDCSIYCLQDCYISTDARTGLVSSMKAVLCLHVVRSTLNNYVNVATMWAAIQVAIPYKFSLFSVRAALRVGGCLVPILFRHVRVCGRLKLSQNQRTVVKGGRGISAHNHHHCWSVFRALLCQMQSGIRCKTYKQLAPKQVSHFAMHPFQFLMLMIKSKLGHTFTLPHNAASDIY